MSKSDKKQESFIGKVIEFIIVVIVLALLQKACTPETLTPEEERLRRTLGIDKEEFLDFKHKLYKEVDRINDK